MDGLPLTEAALDANRLSFARSIWRRCLFELVIPSAIFAFCFFALTYPAIWKWSTHFYCDSKDGFQNEWTLWWFRKAVVELHHSPWYTTWLHAPLGLTLIGHTLQPFNGLVSIFLGIFFSRVQVYNLIVIGSFVSSGVTAFWLARHITGRYIPSLLGGFAFTFTGYHFGQAVGHLQLISAEFLPLFLLAWLRMLERPGIGRAILAGSVLGLNAFCDFYFVFYCVLAGAVLAIFYLPHLIELARSQARSYLRLLLRFGMFIAVAALWCGPPLLTLVMANKHDPFVVGGHAAANFSADPLAAFLPGGMDALGRFTQSYWSDLGPDPTEQSVYLGLSVIGLGLFAVARRRDLALRCASTGIGVWIALAVVSYVLSLGPALHLDGVTLTGSIMPYRWLEVLLPPLKLSGCPSRISVVLALSVAILASIGASTFSRRGDWRSKGILAAFAIVMAIDLWPTPFTVTPVVRPAWAMALRDLPLKGAVISRAYDDPGAELYCQTLYERPMAFGYISRIPTSAYQNDVRVLQCARNGDMTALRRDLGFVYVVLRRNMAVPGLPIAYSDDRVVIQELAVRPATESTSASAKFH